MAKTLKFYNVKLGKTIRTSNYKIKKIRTPRGMRWMAFAQHQGTKMVKFVKP